jgi:hypothetical protein
MMYEGTADWQETLSLAMKNQTYKNAGFWTTQRSSAASSVFV